jgi:hypothetical protein
MEYSHYDEIPKQIQEKLIQAFAGTAEEEEEE